MITYGWASLYHLSLPCHTVHSEFHAHSWVSLSPVPWSPTPVSDYQSLPSIQEWTQYLFPFPSRSLLSSLYSCEACSFSVGCEISQEQLVHK